MKRIILGGFVISALSIALPLTTAAAADLPYKAPPPPPPVVWSWTGFYVGAHGGADRFNKDWFAPDTATNIAAVCAIPGCNYSAGGHTGNSWLAGVQAGFNYQLNQWAVVGAEAQWSWTDLRGQNAQPPPVLPGITDNSKTDNIGTIAGRFGFAWDHALFFVKGGGAWAHDTFFTSVGPPLIAATVSPAQSATVTRWGSMVGFGVEYAFTPNWSAKIEYDHLDFGRQRETLQPVQLPATLPFDYDIRQTVDLVKVGINYRFGYGPVSARY